MLGTHPSFSAHARMAAITSCLFTLLLQITFSLQQKSHPLGWLTSRLPVLTNADLLLVVLRSRFPSCASVSSVVNGFRGIWAHYGPLAEFAKAHSGRRHSRLSGPQ